VAGKPDTKEKRTGKLAFQSDIERAFTESVATPESVATGDFQEFGQIEFSEAGERVIDDDGSPELVEAEGDLSGFDIDL